MGSTSSPPNQTTERGVYVFTTSRSRRRGIQLTTVVDSAQPTRLITDFFFIQTALYRANLRKSHYPQQLFRKSFEITLGLLTTPSSYQHIQTSSSLTQHPFRHDQATALASPSLWATHCSDKHQHLRPHQHPPSVKPRIKQTRTWISQLLQPASAASIPWVTHCSDKHQYIKVTFTYPWLNQGTAQSGCWSSSLSNQGIHIIDHLQQHL